MGIQRRWFNLHRSTWAGIMIAVLISVALGAPKSATKAYVINDYDPVLDMTAIFQTLTKGILTVEDPVQPTCSYYSAQRYGWPFVYFCSLDDLGANPDKILPSMGHNDLDSIKADFHQSLISDGTEEGHDRVSRRLLGLMTNSAIQSHYLSVDNWRFFTPQVVSEFNLKGVLANLAIYLSFILLVAFCIELRARRKNTLSISLADFMVAVGVICCLVAWLGWRLEQGNREQRIVIELRDLLIDEEKVIGNQLRSKKYGSGSGPMASWESTAPQLITKIADNRFGLEERLQSVGFKKLKRLQLLNLRSSLVADQAACERSFAALKRLSWLERLNVEPGEEANALFEKGELGQIKYLEVVEAEWDPLRLIATRPERESEFDWLKSFPNIESIEIALRLETPAHPRWRELLFGIRSPEKIRKITIDNLIPEKEWLEVKKRFPNLETVNVSFDRKPRRRKSSEVVSERQTIEDAMNNAIEDAMNSEMEK